MLASAPYRIALNLPPVDPSAAHPPLAEDAMTVSGRDR